MYHKIRRILSAMLLSAVVLSAACTVAATEEGEEHNWQVQH